MLLDKWLQKLRFLHKSNILRDLCNIFQEKHNNFHEKKVMVLIIDLKKQYCSKKTTKKCI